MVPSTIVTVAPSFLESSTLTGFDSWGRNTRHLASAIFEYRAKEQPAFPSEDKARSFTPNRVRAVIAHDAPRSLNVPVGFLVSSFTHTFALKEPSFLRGVSPSPAEIILSAGPT